MAVGIDDRKPSQRREIAEHAADADQAAPNMSERARGAHRRCELVAPCVDQHYREDGEGGTKEHDLPDRIPLAEKAHERRHHREQQRRYHLERDRLDDVHGV
jgi:hypothetical protein